MTHFIHLTRKQFRAVVSKELNFFYCIHNPTYSIDNDYYIVESIQDARFSGARVRKIKVTQILTAKEFFELKSHCIFLLDPSL